MHCLVMHVVRDMYRYVEIINCPVFLRGACTELSQRRLDTHHRTLNMQLTIIVVYIGLLQNACQCYLIVHA